jgi:hypothetical protein
MDNHAIAKYLGHVLPLGHAIGALIAQELSTGIPCPDIHAIDNGTST